MSNDYSSRTHTIISSTLRYCVMKKLQLPVLILASSLGLSAQTKSDSLKKIRFSGIVLETHGSITHGRSANSDKAEFQEFVKNNVLLDKDLTGYTSGHGQYNVTDYNGGVSLRAFIELGQGKRFRREGFIGVRINSSNLLSSFYTKNSYDTIGTYINTLTGSKIYSVNGYFSRYNYQISSGQFLLPIGINFTTNKTNRLWFAGGLEVCPGITHSNIFSASYSLNKTELLMNENSSYSKYGSYSVGQSVNLESQYTHTDLKGIGFVGYMSLPFNANLRLSKKIKVLKQMNLSTSFAPSVYYASNKFVGSKSGFGINTSLGIRYNW